MRNRQPRLVAVFLLAGAALFPGCRSAGPHAQDGALIGTLAGAGAGYAIGRHNGHRTNGTLIGAAAGGLFGWLLGDQVDHDRFGTHPYVDYTPAPPPVRERSVTRREVIVVHDCPEVIEEEYVVVRCR
jgi:hypothetical protein